MDEAISNAVKNKLLSAFPEGTFARVDVLGYGDDPAVEPGETAVRVFIDRAGRPEENWDSRETLDEFAKANSEGLDRLHDGLLPSIAWTMPDFTRVPTLLGPADLATIDALIMAGVATSRAETLRWAVGRIRENPAYAQLLAAAAAGPQYHRNQVTPAHLHGR